MKGHWRGQKNKVCFSDEFYSYEIADSLTPENKSNNYSGLYRALNRLVAMGYLTFRWRDSASNTALRRKYYRITQKAADFKETN